MRLSIVVALVLLTALTPAAHAAGRNPAAIDAYYACIMGKGAVELQYGVEVNDALQAAIKACATLKKAASKVSSEGSDAVEGDAAVALMKVAGVKD
jgi:hypothetical protein